MRMKPPTLLNHPQVPALKLITEPSQPQPSLKARAYHLLLTRYNVTPDTAKKLLGIAEKS